MSVLTVAEGYEELSAKRGDVDVDNSGRILGHDVGEIQGLLNTWGAHPPLATDGVFGALTETQVRAFQAANKLVVDGIVGHQTSQALQNSDSNNIGAPPSSAPSAPHADSFPYVPVAIGAVTLVAGAVVAVVKPWRKR